MRGVIVSFIAAVLALSSTSHAESLERAPLQQTFAHPLIVGASVSAGFLITGPGSRATQMVMGTDTSTNLAHFGAEGYSFSSISPAMLSGYSVVIGVDYLFWDSTHADISASRVALGNLIYSANRAGIPVVIGDIPRMVDGQIEANRLELNRLIHSQCRPSRHCYVLEVDRLHRLAETRGIVINGYLYHQKDLTVDGLHPNQVASDYLAAIIVQLLSHG